MINNKANKNCCKPTNKIEKNTPNKYKEHAIDPERDKCGFHINTPKTHKTDGEDF